MLIQQTLRCKSRREFSKDSLSLLSNHVDNPNCVLGSRSTGFISGGECFCCLEKKKNSKAFPEVWDMMQYATEKPASCSDNHLLLHAIFVCIEWCKGSWKQTKRNSPIHEETFSNCCGLIVHIWCPDCFGNTIVEQKQVNTRNAYNTVLLFVADTKIENYRCVQKFFEVLVRL